MAPGASPISKRINKLGIKPINTQNILFYYAPLQGALSYSALSVSVMNPSLALKFFPKRDLTNILLFNTLVGSGLYLYGRPHLKSASKQKRIAYSAFGAVTFSLGSILLWAIVRNAIPENLPLCTVTGIGSSLALLKLGQCYTNHIDSLVKDS